MQNYYAAQRKQSENQKGNDDCEYDLPDCYWSALVEMSLHFADRMPHDVAVSPDCIRDLNGTSVPHGLDLWKRKRPAFLAVTLLFNPVKPHTADSAAFALHKTMTK
jgi:hypothetical protein